MTKLCKFCGEDVNGIRHTNLRNEITGAYYEDKNTLFDYILYGVYALVAYFTFDWFFPEVVTETLAAVVMLFR